MSSSNVAIVFMCWVMMMTQCEMKRDVSDMRSSLNGIYRLTSDTRYNR